MLHSPYLLLRACSTCCCRTDVHNANSSFEQTWIHICTNIEATLGGMILHLQLKQMSEKRAQKKDEHSTSWQYLIIYTEISCSWKQQFLQVSNELFFKCSEYNESRWLPKEGVFSWPNFSQITSFQINIIKKITTIWMLDHLIVITMWSHKYSNMTKNLLKKDQKLKDHMIRIIRWKSQYITIIWQHVSCIALVQLYALTNTRIMEACVSFHHNTCDVCDHMNYEKNKP